MQTCPLIHDSGHLFVVLAEGRFLLDTGAPTSFGNVSSVRLEEQRFDLPPSYMGLAAELLSTYIGCETDGILGGDILNQFDILVDAPQSCVYFSGTPLECGGEELVFEEFMGVPIVSATIAGESVKMFFDTGAQVSYFQGDSLPGFPVEGNVMDFYPGFGQFSTDTFRVQIQLALSSYELRCGQLPSLLGMTLVLAGAQGIIGNEVLRGRVAGYFPRRRRLVLQ